ncbi:MAG: acetylornithine/succinylornithine family transaminase [Dehalococcoidia bacterium]|nr:acetylornithine/succinylornithine family transaminase [Dehalococcoidia bacterium]
MTSSAARTDTTDWMAVTDRYFMTTGRRFPVTIVRGSGSRLFDDAGKSYLDFLAGIAVVSLGHANPVVVNAIREEAENLILASNNFYTVPQARLARLLCELSGMERIYFQNGGAEANEVAFKLVRKWGKTQKAGAFEIISTENSFHGRTLGAVAATGTARYREPFEPLPGGFKFVPYGDIEALKAATTPLTCGILLECIQGEAGVLMPPAGYLKEVRRWCGEQNIALILDEVQTGIARTGKMFAFEQDGIQPDIMTLAKGMAGGVPVGAALCNKKLDVFEPGDHGSTFGGNNLSTGVAFAVISHIVESGLVAEVAEKGEYLLGKLRSLEDRYDFVKDARGVGLLCAIELDRPAASAVTQYGLEHGLIVSQVRDSILRLIPPLTVSKQEIDEAVEILDGALMSID